MLAQLKDLDQQVLETALAFPEDVVGIRYSVGHDWSGDPALFFRVLLSDEASREEMLGDITGRVSSKLFDDLQGRHSDYIPYFYFRSKSEQDRLHDPEWP